MSATLQCTIAVCCALSVALPSYAQRPAPRASAAPVVYFPDAGDAWEHRSAAQVGLDSVRLATAIAFAISSEGKNPRSM